MDTTENKPISIGNWIGTFILLALPLVNLIMLIVWAASGGTHPSKKSFAQAYLILIAIFLVIGVAIALTMPAVLHHAMSSLPNTLPTPAPAP